MFFMQARRVNATETLEGVQAVQESEALIPEILALCSLKERHVALRQDLPRGQENRFALES